ncbi:MAG: 3-deoxy-manno-octulosonate cytidylyltransferase [Endomicrobium sp.]|jgi:3-deoxy-manno-octulosonate cytidylyltransferase (CMP-KDO synthetase)|nr:3-deoxy-manno-octulosonate cytidylyltransferase [Endomicrobium sp.]
MKTAVVVPSRYDSSRFPGKLLAIIKGKPLIEYTVEQVKKCKKVDYIAVATDDKRIYDFVIKSLKVDVFMTPKICKSGTDRIAFVASKFLKRFEIFINVQGDEPLIDPALIDEIIKLLKKDSTVEYITAAFPIKDVNLINNPNIVKVVFDKDMYALYFSRFSIPFNRDGLKVKHYKHMGIYGYKRKFLLYLSKIKRSLLERIENLEQLRALENGKKIKIIVSKKDSVGVDTPKDIAKVEKYLQ